MGRPERPIDDDAGPVAEFARHLRQLRNEAGRPSYRELARRAGFSVTALSEAAGGRSLPTLPVVRGYVRACGGNVGEWEERWRIVSADDRDEARSSPYLGLASYGEEQADLFFGREQLTRDVLERLATRRFLAVFGPSGSGKSSLLRAGLLAAVNRGNFAVDGVWVTAMLTPGEQPVAALTSCLTSVAGFPVQCSLDDLLTGLESLDAGLLLVVDQFEELFTVCRDPLQRDRFVHALLAVARADGVRTRVVIGVRADFYGQCATWPGLVTALRDSQILVGNLDQDQLRDVIVKPAEHAGMTVERALVATALAETSTEPGALALMSHALLETWRHSPPGRLTLAAYQESGGVTHAIASTAERVYASYGEDGRLMLRRVFLRLVAIGDEGPDTRRRVTPDELAAGGDPGVVAALVERLVQARLVTTDDGTVQLAHDALIRFWPRLAQWLAESREGLGVQRRLSGAASEWVRFGRDPAALYRGAPLATAREWADRDVGLTGLTRMEREYLETSIAAEDAGRVAARRAVRRLRRLVAALVVLLVAVSGIGGVAAWQRQTALSAEQAAESGQLAAQSAVFASNSPEAAALAALAAWNAVPTTAARSALLSTAACCASTQASLLGEHANVYAVALSPGGKLLAAGGQDDEVYVWDTGNGRQVAILRGPSENIMALAFSPDGTILAVGYEDGGIQLWDPAQHRVLRELTGDTNAVEDLAFSPDGALLASASKDGTVRLWDPVTGGAGRVLETVDEPMESVAFSPDGVVLAAAGEDRVVALWNVADPRHPNSIRPLTGATASIENLAYARGPQGDMIAAEDTNGDVLLWNLSLGTRIRMPRLARNARGLAFSQDGTVLLVAATYHSLGMWDTRTGHQVGAEQYQVPGDVHALAYDPSAGTLAMGGAAGNVQFWQDPIPPFTGSPGDVTGLAAIPGTDLIASISDDDTLRLWNGDGRLAATRPLRELPRAIAVSPDGRFLATAAIDGVVSLCGLPGCTSVRWLKGPPSPSDSVAPYVAFSPDDRLLVVASGHTVTGWDTATGSTRFTLPPQSAYIDEIAFNPRDSILAAVTSRGNVIVWNTRTGRQTGSAQAAYGPLNAIAFSPDGRLIAVGGNDGNITLWDSASLRQVSALGGALSSVTALAFSPDGRTLASGVSNGTITLWDTADRSPTATLTSGQSEVYALAFTRGGTTLFSAHDSYRIIAWNLSLGDVARQDCRILAHDPGLSQAETLVPLASYSRLCPKAS